MSAVSPIASILSFLTLFMFWMRKVVRQNSKYKITKKNTFLGLGQGQRPGWCHYWREKGVQQGRLQEHEGFVRIFFIYFYTKGDYKNMKNMWGTMFFKHFCLYSSWKMERATIVVAIWASRKTVYMQTRWKNKNAI